MNKRMDMYTNYYMHYSEGLAMPVVSSVTCDVTRKQANVYITLVLFTLQRNLHAKCAEHDFWNIHCS